MFSIIGGRIRCEMGKSGHECYTEQLHPRVRPVCFVESGRVACFQNTEHRTTAPQSTPELPVFSGESGRRLTTL